MIFSEIAPFACGGKDLLEEHWITAEELSTRNIWQYMERKSHPRVTPEPFVRRALLETVQGSAVLLAPTSLPPPGTYPEPGDIYLAAHSSLEKQPDIPELTLCCWLKGQSSSVCH